MKLLFYIALSVTAFTPLLGNCQEASDTSQIVYQSDALVIKQVTENAYVHVSFFDTESFGRVACNGMVVTHQNEAVVFDTPVDNASSVALINWISKELNSDIKAVIPTHFHEDCLGGLPAFDKNDIPSYASKRTIQLAREREFNRPANGFEDSLTLIVGDKMVHITYLGEGHTKDNVVGYFPSENVLFGGCLIKTMNASKGNLADANVEDWPKTVKAIKSKYSNVKVVIPGHGASGSQALLDYTIQLFESN
ncbi:MAG: subclass B1 metallo-beta-lactamase [Tunicatimonas sp.]|uniref:subclass B1 metallo-beta-lactamase n=1 Tax=Tunicatimonas sp. TaxID=1940096 RepID=UPI003C793B53